MVGVKPTIRDMGGVMIGHTTLAPAKTGCTVIVFDEPAFTAAEVRGAAPGTRELDLLQPGRTVQRADAIVFTGGSAFGLRTVDGVTSTLANLGRGFPTPAIPVPIVPAAVIFDLANVQPEIPSSDDGATALRTATPLSEVETGQVGAGTGAQWGKILGEGQDGGFYISQESVAGGTVTACVVVNALGVIDPAHDPRPMALAAMSDPGFGHNTTLIAVITDVPCSHDTLQRMCVSAHDALARVIWPSHTVADGDVAFASTVGGAAESTELTLPLCLATELAVEAALRQAKS